VTDSRDSDTRSDDAEADPEEDAPKPGQETHRPRERLGLRAIVVGAARAGRQDVWRILAVALVVSVITAVTEIIVDNIVDPNNELTSIAGSLSTQAVTLLGTVVLSGFLCKLVGKVRAGGERGYEPVRIGRVLRQLPWVRLIVADLVVTVLFIAGLLALVIPGLVVFNLFAVVGPVIEIEHRSAFGGLRRSAHLVRHRFWPVALLATLPVILVGEIESSLPDPHGVPRILEVLAVRGIVIALIEAAIGLVLVMLCYRLIDLDSSEPA
jgi:hypothetical protein